MGGHGGLNILPQKRWNVYNYDNREKVRRDEEAAAREEQVKREESRKHDTELRLEKLRHSRGVRLPDEKPSSASIEAESTAEPLRSGESDSEHINLFQGIRIFDPIKAGDREGDEWKRKFGGDDNRNKKVKKEEVRTVGPVHIGVRNCGKRCEVAMVYMEKREAEEKSVVDDDDDEKYYGTRSRERKKSVGKKSLEERLKRERAEKERVRALLMMKSKKDGGFSSRRR